MRLSSSRKAPKCCIASLDYMPSDSTCVYVHMHTCAHVHIYAYTCISAREKIYMCTYTWVHIPILCIYTHVHVYIIKQLLFSWFIYLGRTKLFWICGRIWNLVYFREFFEETQEKLLQIFCIFKIFLFIMYYIMFWRFNK